MKMLFIIILLLGIVSCERACCMDECKLMVYSCTNADKDVQARCFEVANQCPAACARTPKN